MTVAETIERLRAVQTMRVLDSCTGGCGDQRHADRVYAGERQALLEDALLAILEHLCGSADRER